MKFNIKLVSLLLVLFFISISFVSAADNLNETVSLDNNNDIIKINSKTFDDIQNEIKNAKSGDTISLNTNYDYNNDFKKEGILIDKSLTINGNGNTFDGKNTARIFNVTADNVVFNNVNFINGYVPFIDENCTDNAGAIFCTGSSLTINNCTFKNNLAGCNGGGAVYIENNNSIIKNCIFEENTDINSGGAIKINGTNHTITDNIFKANKALLRHGGAMYIIANDTTVTNNLFTENVAQASGGGFRIEGFNLIVANNTFTYNNATEFLGGGACVLGDDNLVCDNLFKYNFAGRDGGGLDFEGDIVDTDGLRITCRNNTFIENVVTQYGGGMTMNCQYGLVTNNTFLRNYAGMIGAAFRVNGAFEDTGNFTKNIMINNTAGVSGGGIFIRGNGTIVSDNYFFNNHALSVAGGAMTFHGNESMILNNQMISNSANMSGGGVYCDGLNMMFKNNTIIDCHAGTTGGALYLIDDNAIVRDNRFINNTAGTLAGAAQIKSNKAQVINNEIINNTAKSSGGALYIEGKYLKINSNQFISNRAGKSNVGGAIRFIGNKATITKNTFTNNFANEGISIYGHGNNGTISNNNFNPYDEDNEVVVKYLRPETSLTVADKTYKITDSVQKMTATLKDEDGNRISGKEIKFIVNGKTYSGKTNSKGQVTVTLKLKTAKTYTVKVSYAGDNKYKASEKTAKLKINKLKTTLTASNKSFSVTAKSKSITATLKNDKGKAFANKKITFKVNGKTYSGKTNSKGKVTVKLTLNAGGEYKLTVKYAGDSTYASATKTVTVKVNKIKTKITAPAKTFKKSATKKVTVTLKASTGKALSKKKVTLKVNGKTYSAKTNSKGQSTITVKLTNKGIYKYTVKFAGDSKYAVISKTGKITIK